MAIDINDPNRNAKIEVQQWFINCCLHWRPKYPTLYLVGQSNSGKKEMIFDWLLKDQVSYDKIYRPPKGCEFSWAGYNPIRHKVIVFEEFNFNQIKDIEEWKMLLREDQPQ